MLEYKNRTMSLNVKKLLILYLGKRTRDYKKGFFSSLWYLCLCIFEETIHTNMVGLLLSPF